MKVNCSVIILTYNEEKNLEQCLRSIVGWADDVVVVDSYSTDKTKRIAEAHGARVIEHPFVNQAEQLNWALENVEIRNEWVLRLDADEMLTEELRQEIKDTLPNTGKAVGGFYIKRRVYFMGRWIKHGGYYPTWLLRLWRKGKAHAEMRAMDEHMLVEGVTKKLEHDIIEKNQKDLNFWIEKHNKFSSREANEIIATKYEKNTKVRNYEKFGKSQVARKRWVKEKVYLRLPKFLRACMYFCYRYSIRLGFLDGKEGLIFHFLQGFWYRFLVDAKIYEQLNKKSNEQKNK